jgi:hypothetical protein
MMSRKKIFSVLLPLVLAIVSQAQQTSLDCQKRMDFLNNEVDLYAFSYVGQVKEIKILETNPESETPQEVTTTIKFDEKGKISETFLTSARIKMYGRTVYVYDSQNRIVKKVTFNPDGSAVSEDIFGYNSNGGLELKIKQSAATKKVFSKTEYKYEPPESYLEYDNGKFVRRIKLTKDAKCRIIESNLYKEDKSLENRITVSLDDKNNPTELIAFSPRGRQIEKTKYEYEYDSGGNWIKQKVYEWTFRDGSAPYRLTRVRERTITYLNSK